MIRLAAPGDPCVPRPCPGRPRVRIAARPPGIAPLLFGLSLATALPPAALRPTAIEPSVRPEPEAILGPSELAAILDRPTELIGHGRVALAELDARLVGLEVSICVFQLVGGSEAGSGALVILSVVTPDLTARGGGTTIPDLWRLACSAQVQYGIPHRRLLGVGDDAFVASYGDTTAQVAWEAGGRLATVSVTCLGGASSWAADVARAIASNVAGRFDR